MKYWTRLFVVMLVVLLSAASISAQPEPCGTLPGLPCTPTPQPVADRDGDGVADFVDNCPDQAGTGFTNGCPTDVTPSGEAPENITAPLIFPESGECLIGNFGNVNVRVEPSTESDILLVLTPGSFLWALYIVINDLGESWYYTLVDGYVRTDVVQNNGNCDDLTEIRILSIAADLGLPPDDPNAAPPPDDPGCFYWVIYMGNVVCLLNEPVELGIPLPGTDNAPPPDDLFCEYEVIIDGNAICIIDDAVDLTALGVDPAAIPPPDDDTCYRLVINYETGQAYCLVTIPPVFAAPGSGDPNAAPPPDDPTCFYWIVYQGNAICLISIEPNFAIDTGGGDEAPPSEPFRIIKLVDATSPNTCPLYPNALYQDIVIPADIQEAMGDPIPTEGCMFHVLVQTEPTAQGRGQHIELLSYSFGIREIEGDPSDFVLLLPAREGESMRVMLCTVPPEDMAMVCNTVSG